MTAADYSERRTEERRPEVSEESALLPAAGEQPRDWADGRLITASHVSSEKTKNVAAIISILLIGVFISNADGSLVLATGGTISSQFSRLGKNSWLTTSYAIAMCAAQPIVGKLTDVFGRKPVLLTCYLLFAAGVGFSGTAQTFWQVILGRAIAGIGGAGVTVIVSILITDLVPLIQVASWRSYVNVVATAGRSLGGPLGGLLADTIGWRWSFIGQVPFMILAFFLLVFSLKEPTAEEADGYSPTKRHKGSRIGRIDFVGALLITGTIVSFLVAVDIAGGAESWRSPRLIGLFCTSVFLAIVFCIFETRYAREPIFPTKLLLQREVITSYAIASLQVAAQLAMMYSVPLYFQVLGASNTNAGGHLVPAVVGNTFGALLAGLHIRRTGHYKLVTMVGIALAAASYAVLILRWQGRINIWESLEIFPGGFGTGITLTTTFIALTANLPSENIAVATSGIYLFTNLGTVLGVSMSGGIHKAALQYMLRDRLHTPDKKKIIKHILSEVSYIEHLDGSLRELVIKTYIESLGWSHGFSLLCSCAAILGSLSIREHSLKT